jgi:hypothetical protein
VNEHLCSQTIAYYNTTLLLFIASYFYSKCFVAHCWGPSASEGPQKHDLTMSLEYNV